MKRYIVEVTQTGYREVEAEDCNSAEEIADNLNACDGVQWSDFVNVVRAWEKDYEGMRVTRHFVVDGKSILISTV